jgi:uncharacterized protein with HEPN domain
VISEAAARVSEELKARYAQVRWPRIIAFRNILVHAYFGIAWDVVWRDFDVRRDLTSTVPAPQA